MKNNSKSWADVTNPSKYKSVANDWPDLSKLNKSNIARNEECAIAATGSFPDPINNLTNSMQRLNTDNIEHEIEHKFKEIETTKSKDEIRDERKLRRQAKKIEKDEKRYQEKLAAIREPKTQKVKIVDKAVMESYLANQTISSSKHRQSKFKIQSAVKVNLLDLINAQVVKPIDRSFIQNRQTKNLTSSSTQRHKGKKSEFKKKKYLSKLKRSILMSRQLRNQIKSKASSVVIEEASTDLPHPECSETEPPVSVQNETSTSDKSEFEATTPSSSVHFSRKFRPYCDNFTSPELVALTETLLRDIFRFQDRAYNKNEVKARSQKRYYVGFKESMRQLDIGKVKLLIIAPDLEMSSEVGGITETINEMKMKCKNSKVPYVFSLKRRQLGYVLFKKVPVSCVGILNYQGSEENSQKLLQLIQEEKVHFQSAVTTISDNK